MGECLTPQRSALANGVLTTGHATRKQSRNIHTLPGPYVCARYVPLPCGLVIQQQAEIVIFACYAHWLLVPPDAAIACTPGSALPCQTLTCDPHWHACALALHRQSCQSPTTTGPATFRSYGPSRSWACAHPCASPAGARRARGWPWLRDLLRLLLQHACPRARRWGPRRLSASRLGTTGQ